MSPLSALIVDDERLARRELRRMLSLETEVEVTGEAAGVDEAVRLIGRLHPDVVFLDVQMPGRSGFDLLEEVEPRFKVVFVTAHDQFAIRAFEINALDYLLKPVHPDRLRKAIERLLSDDAPLPARPRHLDPDDRLFISGPRTAHFVKVADVACLASAGDYTEIALGNGSRALVHRALKDWEARLPERHFVRIHRSTIVNLEYVERVERIGEDSYLVHLRAGGGPYPMSRRHAARLKLRLA